MIGARTTDAARWTRLSLVQMHATPDPRQRAAGLHFDSQDGGKLGVAFLYPKVWVEQMLQGAGLFTAKGKALLQRTLWQPQSWLLSQIALHFFDRGIVSCPCICFNDKELLHE